MNCQICNKESGKYSLCPECFALMQNGDVKQCINCKRWYKVGDICECLKQTTPPKNEPIIDEPSLTEQKNNNSEEETVPQILWNSFIKPLLICILSIVIAFVLPFGIIFINIHIENTGPHGEGTSWFTALTKEKPSIDVNPTVEINDNYTWIYLGAELIVDCEEDYDEIVILLALKDSNDVVFKQEYITFTNCEAGKKYSKTCTFTAEEILKAKGLDGGLYKYK